MNNEACELILQTFMNLQEDMVVLFQGDKLVEANDQFLDFFKAKSIDDFNASFANFVECFVHHPSYFNATMIQDQENWIDAIAQLEEQKQIVSMITPSFEPHAFLVRRLVQVEQYDAVQFIDITQTLIKKIMIDNAQFSLFSNLDFEDITQIVELLQLKNYCDDEVIIQEGAPGSAMYFIVDGSVEVTNKKVRAELKKGDFFGEIALLKNVARTATVKAISSCKLLELQTADFQNFIEKKPQLLEQIQEVAQLRQNV